MTTSQLKLNSKDLEKNIIKTYNALQILVESKFEVFMNLILFRNVISKFWDEEMNN